MARELSPAQLRAWLRGSEPFALIDIREPGEFGRGHLLAASNLPASRIALSAPVLLPNRGVPLLLCAACEAPELDDARTRLQAATEALHGLGYRDVRWLQGGPRAWQAAGFEVFTGFNVPSKTFGEWLEMQRHTPHVSASELAGQVARGEVYVVDCRPADEHARGAVPGADNLPGIELGLRLARSGRPAGMPVVVHCAGRTRGIVAAQSLIDLGHDGPVAVLENGLIGWELANLKTKPPQGGAAALPPAQPDADLVERAWRWAARWGVTAIDEQGWEELRAANAKGAAAMVAHGFDVRTAAEHAAGAPPGMCHVPGGQLLQALDDHVATRHATLVLYDPLKVRALMVAAYLREMGWPRVHVLFEPAVGKPSPIGTPTGGGEGVSPDQAQQLAQQGWPLIDLGPSTRYRQAHVAGAPFAVPAFLHRHLSRWEAVPGVVLICDDGRLSTAAAPRLRTLLARPVQVVAGGLQAWQAQGLPVTSEAPHWLDDPLDVPTTPYDYQGDIRRQLQAYIDWELELVGKARRDGSLPFCRDDDALHRP